MVRSSKDTKRGGRLTLPALLALAGLLLAGTVTPMLASEQGCNTGRSCTGGTLFECGSSADCVCGSESKCTWL